MFLAHRIRLVPTVAQERYFVRACGVARFAYNWALAERERRFAAGEERSEAALRRQLNAIKDKEFPWMREVTKNAPQQAIKNLGRAYTNFLDDLNLVQQGRLPRKRVRTPRYKLKGRTRESFRADSGPEKSRPNGVRSDGKRIRLPKAGWVKMREPIRFKGRILSVVVSRECDRWYASVTVDISPWEPPERNDEGIAGCDLGVYALATVLDASGCTTEPGVRPLRRHLKQICRLNRSLHRRVKGSRNRAKAKAKLARLHARIANIRGDALHKFTTRLVRKYRFISIEDLNVAAMFTNRYLSQALHDLRFGEFRRQLRYKALLWGSTVLVVDRWFPSSKRCSVCGARNATLGWGTRRWTCLSCGAGHDRDENAARNLYSAASSAVAACGANGAGGIDYGLVKLFAEKQEGLHEQAGTVKRSQVGISAGSGSFDGLTMTKLSVRGRDNHSPNHRE